MSQSLREVGRGRVNESVRETREEGSKSDLVRQSYTDKTFVNIQADRG